MRSPRRLVALAFALVVAGGAAGTQPAPAAAAGLTVSGAELEMVTLLNAQRRSHGLRNIRVDPRLMTIARARSTNMATYHYFSHTQPDGRTAFSYLRSAGVQWHAAGEIIAWNTHSTFADSAIRARDGWLASAGHRAIVLSAEYNYVGIGLAVDASNGRKLWTGVFMRGPDRTGGYAAFGAAPSTAIPVGATNKTVTVRWSGGDVLLQTMTAGLSHFRLRIRTDGGVWTTWAAATTATSKNLRVWKGHRYDIELSSCDKVGNCGGWVRLSLAA